jgi:predicted outer membrane repeat protein
MAKRFVPVPIIALAVCLCFPQIAHADEVTIGTGTNTWYYPLSTSFHDARTQTIYLAGEIGNSYTINSLALNLTVVPGQVMNNFTIRMKHTDLSAYSSFMWESSGWTNVYQANQTISTTGWVPFTFSTPFIYNGGQSLMVDISFNNSSYSLSGYSRYTEALVNRTLANRVNSTYGDPLTWSAQTPYPVISSYVPNIKLGVSASGVTAMPILSLASGTYNSEPNTVVICATAGATMHYIIGTDANTMPDPTESDPVVASGDKVFMDHSLTLKVKAWKDGLSPSTVRSGTYAVVVARPAMNPDGGSYNVEKNVVVTCSTPGSTIHYTTNGLDPTESDPVVISGQSVYVDRSLTLKAKAWKGAMGPSTVKSAGFTIVASTPTFSCGSGSSSGYDEQTVVISCATPGAAIHYSTTGVDPTENDPVIASGGSFYVDHTLVLKAKAWKGAMTPSGVVSFSFTLQSLSPHFRPTAGTYYAEQDVTVTCAATGSTIRYTTNGMDPTESDTVIASGATIHVDHSLTLKAKSWKGVMTPSPVATASYTLQVPTVVFSPASGGITPGQPVVLTCAMPGAAIHYTTNGIDPNESDTIIASGGSITVYIEPPTTVKARAYRAGCTTSAVAAATYHPMHIYYVSPNDGNDIFDGLSWPSAKSTLTAAVNASTCGDEIWVAAATYKPTSPTGAGYGPRDKHFTMKNGVRIYGGFAGSETSRDQRDWKSNITVLSGDLDSSGGISDGDAYHVFYNSTQLALDNSAVLDGFTITGGNANARTSYGEPIYNGTWYFYYPAVRQYGNAGGGMYNSGCAPRVANCIFSDNVAFNAYGTWLIEIDGGDYYIPAGWGGAIYNEDPCSVLAGRGMVLENCLFIRNSSFNSGGAICDAAGNLTVIGCMFVGNRAGVSYLTTYPVGGSAITEERSNLAMTNCVLAGNTGYESIAIHKGGQIIGCTMASNNGGYGAVAVYDANYPVSITNTIFWGNVFDTWHSIAPIYGTASVAYCDIQGGYAGNGNTNTDPNFVRNPNAGTNGWGNADDDYGDLRLRPRSACIDKGNNSYVTAVTDISGNPRILDGDATSPAVVDMGAYEWQCAATITGDISPNCAVDFADYAMLASKWQQSGCTSDNQWCAWSDVNQDGSVDVRDLALVAANWLAGK